MRTIATDEALCIILFSKSLFPVASMSKLKVESIGKNGIMKEQMKHSFAERYNVQIFSIIRLSIDWVRLGERLTYKSVAPACYIVHVIDI